MRHNRLIIFILACVFFSSCTFFETGEPAGGFSGVPENFRVIFSTPGINPETSVDAGIADALGTFIRSARKKLDICIYELSEPKIYDAVLDVFYRGIPVRFIGDIANTDYSGYQALMGANVPHRLGHYADSSADRIMHNKFVIVDGEWISMGSANYTGSGTAMNHENVLFIRSTNLAAYYTKEFDNIYNNGTFGLDKTPFSGFTDNTFVINPGRPDETQLEVYFTPYPNAHPGYANTDMRILECISNAQHSICVAMFAFTHVEIANAIIHAATNRGIRVFLALDKGWHTASEWSVHQKFIDAGLNIRYDGNENFEPGNPYHGAKIHDKFMVVDAGYDSGRVFTGSFNFSSAAATDGNDENCIIISNRMLTTLYQEEFARIYGIGTHPTRDQGGDRAPWQAVLINEINWAGSRPDSGSYKYSDKFVELKNTTANPVNIGGWQLVGTTQKSWRIISHIFPAGTVIPPGGHHVLFFDTLDSAFAPVDGHHNCDYFLYLHHSSTQPNVYLVLKDTHQNFIDIAGSATQPVTDFGGTQGPYFTSIYRTGTDGTLTASWAATPGPNAHVKNGYTTYTRATPGTD